MVVINLPADPPWPCCWGQKGQNSAFSEHGHVAYQIIENRQMQQHGSRFFARTPLPIAAVGVKRSKLNFSRTWLWCISNYRESGMQQHDNKYFTCRPPPSLTLGMGSIGQNYFFSEHGHVAYQIKGNHRMQQHGSKYFASRPLPDPTLWPCCWGPKVKIKLFQNMVMLHIKLEHIPWRAFANPHARSNLMVIDPLTPSQGHQFDCRVKFFSVSWATVHPPL